MRNYIQARNTAFTTAPFSIIDISFSPAMLRKFFYGLNILAILVLGLSCLATSINPNSVWQLSFIGFAFPLVLVVNFLFLIGWLIARNRFGLLPLVAIVLSWPFIRNTFAVNLKPAGSESGIKVMTWNVKNFDLYNWSHNMQTRSEMMELIEAEQPDILCLQEFYTNNQFFHNLEYLRDTLGYTYCYFPPSVRLSKVPKSKLQQTLWKSGVLNQEWGVATFSKYPIIATGNLRFDSSSANNCIYTDLAISGKTLRVFNVHFQSIHLGYSDYATLDSLAGKKQTNWASIKNIAKKMKRAYTKRANQAQKVTAELGGVDDEILCGDFNDVPTSYTYATVSKTLKDAFVQKGFGFGTTYVGPLAIFRIDYVLYGGHVSPNSYRCLSKQLSDHYPVCATFSF